MKRFLLIFHVGDLDGWGSAAAMIRHCEREGALYDLVPIQYGDEFPLTLGEVDEYDKIMMADYSFQPFSKMIRWEKRLGNRFLWFDHHGTAIRDHEACGSPIIGFQTEQFAACEIVYRRLLMDYDLDDTVPDSLRLLSQYNIWDHSDPRCLPFQYAMRPNMFRLANSKEYRDSFFDDPYFVEKMLPIGDILLKEEIRNDKFRAKKVFPVKFEGFILGAINDGTCSSKTYEHVANKEQYDAFVSFVFNGLTKKWVLSFRSHDTKRCDVSVLAKKLGGGGHAGAAGCSVKELPFCLDEEAERLQAFLKQER